LKSIQKVASLHPTKALRSQSTRAFLGERSQIINTALERRSVRIHTHEEGEENGVLVICYVLLLLLLLLLLRMIDREVTEGKRKKGRERWGGQTV